MLGALLLRHFWGVHRGRRPSERTTPVPERESLAVTGRALNRYGAAIRKAAGFLIPSDVTPGGQLASRFTWKTTDGLSTHNRWGMSLPEQPNFTTG